MADYVMVSRRLVRTWLFSTLTLLLLVGGAYWYAYNNARQMCGIISIQDETYKKEPPPSSTGKLMAREFNKVRKTYHC